MCKDYEEESKQIYDFTFIDEDGEVNNMHKELKYINGNIEDILYQMKNFLLMCGYKVDELIVKMKDKEFSSNI